MKTLKHYNTLHLFTFQTPILKKIELKINTYNIIINTISTVMNKLSKNELLVKCQENGINVNHKKNKKELIVLFQNKLNEKKVDLIIQDDDDEEEVNNNHLNLKQLLTIQKYVRRYLTQKHILIPPSSYQTKDWRKEQKWYTNGKSNECEKYQINLIEKIIKNKIIKTDDRIYMKNNEIISNKKPMINNDGYEWSENFDGLLIQNNNKYYFNLKFVCDSGGAQTRTLREVYHFIKHQMEHLIKFNMNNIFFINILDGDTSFKNMDKFKHLINDEKYKQVKKYVFIGSLYEFQKNKKKLQIKDE